MEISKTLNTILTLVSGASWTVVYILVIIRSFRDKTYGIPFWALAFNISWEFIFSFVLVSTTVVLQHVINEVWFAFDAVIIVSYFLYGLKDWPTTVSKKLFYPYSALVIIIACLFVYLISVELDHKNGMYAAFIQNLMMLFLFIKMFIERKSMKGQSVAIAAFKLVGTLTPTIIYGAKSPFVLFLGAGCFVADTIYLVMLIVASKDIPVTVAEPEKHHYAKM